MAGLEVGQTYSIYVPRENVMEGTYNGTATLGGVGGFWSFEVRNNGFDDATHTVYVNPAMVATVIPSFKG